MYFLDRECIPHATCIATPLVLANTSLIMFHTGSLLNKLQKIISVQLVVTNRTTNNTTCACREQRFCWMQLPFSSTWDYWTASATTCSWM